MPIVCKFGGSSLANSEQFKKVKDIIESDENRLYVIPSAPGKARNGDQKVTDLLILLYNMAVHKLSPNEVMSMIEARYREILDGIGIEFDLKAELDTILSTITSGKVSKSYVLSRGEYLNGKILAAYLGYDFVDAATVIRFDENGQWDEEASYRALEEMKEEHTSAVIPGFYGSTPSGKIITFSRGGSDLSGAIVARGVGADLYENWTDVSGFLMADPKIVQDPRPIERITYAELRELSYIGAQVLHEGTVSPVREKNIPLNIRNTNQPDHPGTMIRERFDEPELADENLITGIAGRKDFSVITITKNGMSSQAGVLRQILEVLERYGINVDYLPSGIDTVSLVVSAQKVTPCLYPMLGDLQKELKPDSIHVTDNMAIVAAVGRKMAYKPGTSGRIFAKLGENGINIRMITQGPEELNIIVGVDGGDFERAIRVLYDSFVK